MLPGHGICGNLKRMIVQAPRGKGPEIIPNFVDIAHMLILTLGPWTASNGRS